MDKLEACTLGNRLGLTWPRPNFVDLNRTAISRRCVCVSSKVGDCPFERFYSDALCVVLITPEVQANVGKSVRS